jgi:hypothetical protein
MKFQFTKVIANFVVEKPVPNQPEEKAIARTFRAVASGLKRRLTKKGKSA